MLFGDLLVVTVVAHGPQGFWAAGGLVGVEFPIPLTAGALAIALLGYGGLSLDGVLGLAYPAALTPGAVIVALIGAGTLLVIRAIRGTPQAPAS